MSFFTALGTEFGKIVWPTWAEAFGHAAIVITTAVLVGYYLGALDAIFAVALRAIIG